MSAKYFVPQSTRHSFCKLLRSRIFSAKEITSPRRTSSSKDLSFGAGAAFSTGAAPLTGTGGRSVWVCISVTAGPVQCGIDAQQPQRKRPQRALAVFPIFSRPFCPGKVHSGINQWNVDECQREFLINRHFDVSYSSDRADVVANFLAPLQRPSSGNSSNELGPGAGERR